MDEDRAQTTKTKILIIDDQPSIIDLLIEALEPQGYEMISARSEWHGLKAKIQSSSSFRPALDS